MCGCEAWSLTLKEESKLLTAKRKIFRRVLGPSREEDNAWRLKKNLEIKDLANKTNIMGETKSA